VDGYGHCIPRFPPRFKDIPEDPPEAKNGAIQLGSCCENL